MKIFVFLLMLGQFVYAQPRIQRDLQRYFSDPSQAETKRAIILVIKDKAPIPNRSFSPAERPLVEQMMMENAKLSQQEVLKSIGQIKRKGTSIAFRTNWLTNTIAVFASQTTLKKVLQSEDVVAVFPNRIYKVNPYFHGFENPHRGDAYTYGLKNVHIPELRAAKPDLDGHGVKVGIIDTGVDAAHPDLKGKVLMFKDFVKNQTTPYDDFGHGTHVAGTIAGGKASGTAIGMAPGAQLIVGKVFDENGSSTDEVLLQAMQWIADPDNNPSTNDAPALVSNSWGGGEPDGSMDPATEPLCKAADAWLKLGIAPVFAAGNSGPSEGSVNIPGACPSSITVGATDEKDKIAGFSSRGPAVWKTGSFIKPTVSAPGVRVYSSLPGGKYGTMSGTSMATPHTSGMLALIYQAYPNSDVATAQKILIGGVDDEGAPGNDNMYGWGRINALKTLKLLQDFAK